MISKNFQESLKYYRRARNLTQDELGGFLGVSGQTIYKYENGIHFPSAKTLEKILNYFDIDPNTLFQYQSAVDSINDEIQKQKTEMERIKRIQSIHSDLLLALVNNEMKYIKEVANYLKDCIGMNH